MESYADVILPLPLAEQFTYSLPADLEGKVRRGCRVTVPFGKRKTYTAIVTDLHCNRPEGYAVKPILDLLDEKPVLLEEQFALWKWIARYYLCSLGEIFKAALPQGLKSGYKPRIEVRVRLCGQRNAEEMRNLLDGLKRAPKQRLLIERYLELSGYYSNSPKEVSRKELTEEGASVAGWNALLEKGILETYEREVGRLQDCDRKTEESKPLSSHQKKAFEEIRQAFKEKKVCLLHGVTSSGKTEVYIQLIRRCIDEGKQVLYLLPEIALTQQITERLQNIFGSKIGIYHSKFSDAERVEVWKKQLSDHPYEIILGVRSSIFLPFRRLGLVIVDEEHENSYKQQEPAPRYHARSAAIVLASMYKASTLLGTATPCLESYHNALTGKYALVELTRRYLGLQMPDVKVVDIKDLAFRKQMEGPFSMPLIHAMQSALEKKQQIILFQNRRGYSSLVECRICGWVPRCKNCDVSLTYHREKSRLVCHYCGYTMPKPLKCPACEESDFMSIGYGTERIEDSLHTLFPAARVARLDLDTTRSRTSYEKIIADFQKTHTDILIGTQMVSKGLDFDNVAVVGILNADELLNYPDFRAGERAYQLMAQVAGRSGRKNRQGEVFLQTKTVDSPIIADVVSNDYLHFFRMQSEERRIFHYPPFYRLIYLYMRHRDSRVLDNMATETGRQLRMLLGESRIVGPDQPAVARVQQRYIRKIMLKIENSINIYSVYPHLTAVQKAVTSRAEYRAADFYFDIDPLN